MIREALLRGPVLVQTPRAGYALALACERCRTPSQCAHCSGPLALTGPTTPPACRWCGTSVEAWSCPECGARGLRAPVLGDARTAEELGRSFAPARVRTSSGDHVLADVSGESAIVVATPGAEPVADGGYAAVVLLDTWLLLGRADLRSAEEALRRWSNAAGLVRPGGRVLAVGDPAHPALQALVRWDHSGFAEREIGAAPGGAPAARVAARDHHRRRRRGRRRPDAAVGAARGRGARAGARRATTRSGSWCACRGPRAPTCRSALGELQRCALGRKLDAVRIQVDP